MRKSGMLMPVSALPGAYGIGCFSKEAYEFVDILKEAGQKLWQILPLGQTGYGDSPYQSFSTYAGNPYLIDLDTLCEEGLLTKEEVMSRDWGSDDAEVDYEKIYNNRFEVLKIAYDNFKRVTRRHLHPSSVKTVHGSKTMHFIWQLKRALTWFPGQNGRMRKSKCVMRLP